MLLWINGKKKECPEPINIVQLLTHLELPADRVVVELNREIVTSDHHVDIQLQDGDTLELIQFVGGG